MQAPETPDQAHALANLAAREYASLQSNLSAARAQFEVRQAEFLLRRPTLGDDELALAEAHLSDDAFEVECAQHAVWHFAPEISVWESGYQFNDRGEDYTVAVLYSPLTFQYEVHYSDEHGQRFFGSYDTLAKALVRARVEVYGHDETEAEAGAEPEAESRPVPELSREESTAAGDVIVHVNGQVLAVKDFVDYALDQANLGCGLHYDVFARRAREVMEQLPYHVTAPNEREALTKYLAYDRF